MEFVSGNVFIREMFFEKSEQSRDGHKHNFDHTTYVVRGALRFERLAEDGSITHTIRKRASDGHNWVLIKAGVKHRIIAEEDNSLGHCIYSHRNSQGEIVQEYDGWAEAFA